MKNVFRLLILIAAVASLTLPALAQDTTAGAAATSAQDTQAKADMYAKFLDLKKKGPAEQKQAADIGKEYVSKYGSAAEEAVKNAKTDAEKSAADADKKIVDYIQGWVTKYDKAAQDFAFTESFNNKDYAKTFELGRAQLKEQSDNLGVILLLTRAGYVNAGPGGPNNKSLNPEAARMTRRAIELIESGKAPDFLNYTLGLVTQETSPADAGAAFIKAAQSNSTFKREPSTFIYLGNGYETGELKKLVDEYGAAFPPNVPIPDEKKAQYTDMLARIGVVQDRIIDAYARAVALMGAEAKYAVSKKAVMNKLTAYYKQRHEDKEDGLQELVNNVLSKPIPIPGQEPATPVPASSSGMNGAGGTGTTPVGQTVANPALTPAAGTAPKPAATPTMTAPASTTPKPKPRQ